MSVVVPTIPPVGTTFEGAAATGSPVPGSLSAIQRRTARDLIEPPARVPFRPALAGELRTSLEDGLAPFLPWRGPPLSLTKERLNLLARCEGLFEADLRGERPPFVHTRASAVGTLAHKSVEIDVRSSEEASPEEVATVAVERLRRDRRFGPYWDALEDAARSDLLGRAADTVERFRASFPPVRDYRRRLAPVSELWLETTLGHGAVVLRGKADLLVGFPRAGRATRVVIDLKTGRPSPDHAEDMRLYALLFTLRAGAPPARVATFFLSSGQWQPEEVDEAVLSRAVDRTLDAIEVAARLGAGSSPDLRPGRHCVRCPRIERCPAVAVTG